jgi:hypothetical protein
LHKTKVYLEREYYVLEAEVGLARAQVLKEEPAPFAP